MSTIAVLGTGLLGSGFATKALDNGHTVRVWNRTPAKCEPLVEAGCAQGATPAEAVAGCSRVHLVLAADDAVDAVIAQLLPGLAEGAWIVDHSTNLPERVAARCARLRADGVRYVHAPVFMGPSNSRDATGQMLISGPVEAVAALEGALSEMTGELRVVGGRDEDAAVRKLLGNGLIIGLSALAGDLLQVGRAGGLADEQILEALAAFSPMAARMGKRSAGHHGGPVTFELAMARKDVRLMIETGGADGMGVLPGLAAAMDALIEAGHGAENYTLVSAPKPG